MVIFVQHKCYNQCGQMWDGLNGAIDGSTPVTCRLQEKHQGVELAI